MNVPKLITFETNGAGVKALMEYNLPEGYDGLVSATFGLSYADYPTVGDCLKDLLTEMGEHARRAGVQFEAEAKRRLLEGAL